MAEIYVDVQNVTGEIKPLNGLCNAPQMRTLKYWKRAGVPYTRLHDSFLGLWHVVDVSAVFPDFSKDENDPASYDFAMTDRYLAKVLESGAGIIYRLGETLYDMPDVTKITTPPASYEKWGRICAHIIMHYNDGWNEGFHYGINRSAAAVSQDNSSRSFCVVWDKRPALIGSRFSGPGGGKKPGKKPGREKARARHTSALCRAKVLPARWAKGLFPAKVLRPGGLFRFAL